VCLGSKLSPDMTGPASRKHVSRRPSHRRESAPARAARRLFNVLASVCGLVALAIPFVVTMAVIKATSPGPVFFRQVRVGRNGRLFHIYKFRTMFESNPSAVPIVGAGEPASVTPVGGFLRRTKIDEFPQLINVLVGNMSLVGPRPELPEFVAKYSSEDRRIVLSVLPGLTDFASIRFRNEELLLSRQKEPFAYYERVLMRAKLRYCRLYVRRASLGLDLYLIAQTIVALGFDFLTEAVRALRRSRTALNRTGLFRRKIEKA
jgi:lipopolysaccharide/colanic/teichoic acid biosynthesis glycosyltransferase